MELVGVSHMRVLRGEVQHECAFAELASLKFCDVVDSMHIAFFLAITKVVFVLCSAARRLFVPLNDVYSLKKDF